jgi:DNA-binding response OmpR family regulator
VTVVSRASARAWPGQASTNFGPFANPLKAGLRGVDQLAVAGDVLIVDDDANILEMLGVVLEDAGHDVRVAANGREAVTALEQSAPQCMVLDLMMPELDGHGVLRTMRERNLAPETRVLVLTCKVHAGEFIEAWQLGADEYVTKPVDPFQLVDKLHTLMAVPVAQLQQEREAKLEKAVLLARLESSFGKPPSWGSSIRSRL